MLCFWNLRLSFTFLTLHSSKQLLNIIELYLWRKAIVAQKKSLTIVKWHFRVGFYPTTSG